MLRTITVTVFLIRVIVFLFLLFWLTLYLSESFAIISIEVFMVKVAFLTVFTNLVEVVHVQLNGIRSTCLTNEE